MEIINLIGTDLNSILEQLSELWDFDEVDLESTNYSVTYGSAKLSKSNNGFTFGVTGGSTANISMSTGFVAVKTEHTIMLCGTANNTVAAVAFGTTTSLMDASTGKGAAAAYGGSLTTILDGKQQANITTSQVSSSDTVLQVADIIAPTYGAMKFDNLYRLLVHPFINYSTNRGKNSIGEVLYVAGAMALKEE